MGKREKWNRLADAFSGKGYVVLAPEYPEVPLPDMHSAGNHWRENSVKNRKCSILQRQMTVDGTGLAGLLDSMEQIDLWNWLKSLE